MNADGVLVTGLGAVSALGTGVPAFWAGLGRADSRPADTRDPSANVPVRRMYLASDVDGTGDRISRFAMAATDEALADAALPDVDPARVAVVLGTTMGAASDTPYALASAIADRTGARGGCSVIANACAASGYAVSAAVDLIRTGEADVVVAGGVEGYARAALACFNRMGAIDPDRCRPFDAARRGTVFGEGAAMLVVESAEHAGRRAAPAYGRIAGTGWSCDSHHLTAPEPEGAQVDRALRGALAAAGVRPDEVGCVVPHGTGTELNDMVESRVLAQVFDDVPPVYSLKALIGHTGGAAGAFAVLAAALILRHGIVPPNIPIGNPDPVCPLPVGPHAVTLTGRAAVVNAYAFGGNNISLVLCGDAA